MKKIGVITTGGDAPGMNAAIRSVVRTAHHFNMKIVGFKRGWWGLIERDYIQMNLRSVSGIINRGGTILNTVRCKKFKERYYRKVAIRNLKDLAPDGLIVIGGDGSMRSAGILHKESNVPVVGIPASIDNDIAGTDETIGFDTAINTALDAIDKIRDTAQSHQRVFIIEVMGRSRGFLALSVGIASGAEFILIPEIKWDKNRILKEIETFEERGKTSCLIVMAEGAGNSDELAKFLEKSLELPVRVSKIGYIQRGGSPTVDSRFLASIFGYEAVKSLKNSKGGIMLAWVNDKIMNRPISYSTKHYKKINKGLIKIADILSR